MEELNAEIPTDEIEQAGALMVKFDFIEAEPDTSTLYFEGE